MAEAVAPIDAEALMVSHLTAQLATRGITATVATRVPNPRPTHMVRISLADTLRQTLGHFYSRVIVECWAPTEVEASTLARTAYGVVTAMEGEDTATDWVAGVVTVGGPVNFPEPEVGPRYQFTADVLTRGELV
jgi:hypothetical protein